MDAPRLIAFDTATEWLSVAAAAPGGERVAEEPGGAVASARLLPLALQLLAELDTPARALQAVVFGRGPGAFTGLRTACAVAQGLALGAGCPVIAVDSLMLVAEAAVDSLVDDEVWVAMDARMDEVYAGRYRRSGSAASAPSSSWQVLDAPALYTLEALAARWQAAPPTQVVGSAVEAFAGRLPFGAARQLPAAGSRGAALLRLGRRAWADGAVEPAEAALPLYLRDKVALTTAERLAARDGAQRARSVT